MAAKQKTADKLAVKYLPTSQLIPYARNSRIHSEAQIKQIASSIQEFGFTNPVLIDGQRGIIAGHGRVVAAELIGMKDVPTIELGHLTEAQKRAYVIADNKLALNAEWDFEMLGIEVAELKGQSFDVMLTGFSPSSLDAIEIGVGGGFESGANTEGREPPPSDLTFFELTLTAENKAYLVEAINKAKAELDTKSSEEALMRICEVFNAEG